MSEGEKVVNAIKGLLFNPDPHGGEIIRTYLIYCAGCKHHASIAEDKTPINKGALERLLKRSLWRQLDRLWFCPKCAVRHDLLDAAKSVREFRAKKQGGKL